MSGTTTYFGITYPTNTDYVKDGASAMQTIATGFDSAVAIPTYNNQTGTTYTFVLADTSKVITSNNASAVTFTIPPQSSVAWATGASLRVANYGAGAITFAGGVGVTVTNTATTVPQYGEATLVRTGSDAWTVVAVVATAPGLTLITTQTVSAASNIYFNDVFNSTYNHYRLLISGAGSTGSYFAIRVRNGTTDYTGTQYRNAVYYFTVAGGVGFNHTGTGDRFNSAYYATPDSNFAVYDFYPKGTNLTMLSHSFEGASAHSLGGNNVTSTSNVTGLNIYPVSGTFTGTFTLYGYKKS